MIEVWVLLLVVVTYADINIGAPSPALRIQLQTEEQCDAVKRFLIELNGLVSDSLHMGDCTRVLKEADQPTPPMESPAVAPPSSPWSGGP